MKALPYILCAILLAGVVFLLLERRTHINAADKYRAEADSAIVLRDGYLLNAEITAARNALLLDSIQKMEAAVFEAIAKEPTVSEQVDNALRTFHNADADSVQRGLMRAPN